MADTEETMAAAGAIPVPDTGAIVAVDMPNHRFRVGKQTHQYNYEVLPGITSGDLPVFKCSRGRDDALGKLYLYFDPDTQCWHAKNVVGDVTSVRDIESHGQPAFRATPNDNVLQEGPHQWQCFDVSKQEWWEPMSFQTTFL